MLSCRHVSYSQHRNFILQPTSDRIQRNIYILWARRSVYACALHTHTHTRTLVHCHRNCCCCPLLVWTLLYTWCIFFVISASCSQLNSIIISVCIEVIKTKREIERLWEVAKLNAIKKLREEKISCENFNFNYLIRNFYILRKCFEFFCCCCCCVLLFNSMVSMEFFRNYFICGVMHNWFHFIIIVCCWFQFQYCTRVNSIIAFVLCKSK